MVQFVPRGDNEGQRLINTAAILPIGAARSVATCGAIFLLSELSGHELFAATCQALRHVYWQPPLTRTPYHDPYFEEHYWEALREGRTTITGAIRGR